MEIPPKFAGRPPVNPKSRAEAANGQLRAWKGAQGLAEDLRYYGHLMRDQAVKRIGHLYPKATLPDGSQSTVIAWLWARTVRSPDPAARGAIVPLVSSFMLSTREGQKAWVEPVIDATAPDGWRFEVRTGALTKSDEERLKSGTIGRSNGGTCILTGSSMPFSYVRNEGQRNGLGVRLMAVVAEGQRSRIYLSPSDEQVAAAALARPAWEPEGELPDNPRDFKTPNYGMRTFASLFNPRQLAALTTFSDLVSNVRQSVLVDANVSGMSPDPTPLHEGGTGAAAYGDAVATYLAFAVDRVVDRHSSIATWDSSPSKLQLRNTFARQAIPMTWDFGEGNPFCNSSGTFTPSIEWVSLCVEGLPASTSGGISNINASKNSFPVRPVIVFTDPPYYDNIGYADLSDFFYVWLKHSLGSIWPGLFRRLTTPKTEELVATPYRHGGKDEAEAFFMRGMGEALASMCRAATDGEPLTIYYAFKQSELAEEGIISAGWASFLQAVVGAGLVVDATWPVRTELANRLIAKDANALASSIVLVCRKRLFDAEVVTRADFIRALKREMPLAIDAIRKAGVGPVDMQQSVIGPGMGVFSRHARVLEDDDSAMTVKTALAVINRVWEEIENELDQAFDAPTQVALAWFATYGFDAKPSGELITLANAKNVPLNALFSGGVFQDLHGRAALTPRGQLPPDWMPAGDATLTVWECVQHTARALNAPDGGGDAAAELVVQMGQKAEEARALAHRLFEIATNKGWAAEALVYNVLAQEWTKLEDRAATLDDEGRAPGPNQATFTFEGTA